MKFYTSNFNFFLSLIKKNKINININLFNKLFIYRVKTQKKFEKKIGTLPEDLKVTKRCFYYIVNPSWERIFFTNLDFSIFIFITKFNFNFIFEVIGTYYIELIKYLSFDWGDYILKIVDYNLIYDFSGLKSLKRFYTYDFFSTNFLLMLKNSYKIFSPYNKFSDTDYLELLFLSIDYVLVPYYYIEEWFHVQFESYLTFFKILLIKHYSNPKFKTVYYKLITRKNFYLNKII